MKQQIKPQKAGQHQPADNDTLFNAIQSEVSAENAPLLHFITRYAGYIASGVIIILLILGGMAIWRWHTQSKNQEAREALARAMITLNGSARDQALKDLAETAPDSVKLSIYLSLGQSALENNNPAMAASAYAEAAKIAKGTGLGLAANLGNVGSLLNLEDYKQALTLLQTLESEYPQAAQSIQFRMLLAEAAVRAGDTSLAIKTYEVLSKDATNLDSEYFTARAKALAGQKP